MLPEWISCLSKLLNIDAEKDGAVCLKLAPDCIQSLPCWANHSTPSKGRSLTVSQMLRSLRLSGSISSLLQQVKNRKDSECSGLLWMNPAFSASTKDIRNSRHFVDPRTGQSMDVPKEMIGILRVHSICKIGNRNFALYSARAKGHQAPRLFSRDLERVDSTIATVSCKYGIMCGICFRIPDAQKTLICGHIFCKSCLESCLDLLAIDGLCSCPVCKTATWLTIEELKNLADGQMDYEIFEKARLEINHQKNIYEAPKCKYPDCNAIALQICKYCGYFCPTHLQTHNVITNGHVTSVISTSLDANIPSPERENQCNIHKSDFNSLCLDCTHSPVQCDLCNQHNHDQGNEGHRILPLGGNSETLSNQCREWNGKVDARKTRIEEEIKKLNGRQKKIQDEYLKAEKRRLKLFEEIREKISQLDAMSKAQLEHLTHIQDQDLKRQIEDLLDQQYALDIVSRGLKTQLSDPKKMSVNNLSQLLGNAISLLKAEVHFAQIFERSLQSHIPFHLPTDIEKYINYPTYTLAALPLPMATVQSEMKSTHFWGVAYQPESGTLLTCNEDHGSITVWNNSRQPIGGFRTSIGLCRPSQHPRSICCSPHGLIAVVDDGDQTVKVWSRHLDLVRVIGYSMGDRDAFRWPVAVCFDSAGRLFVADGFDNSIHRWSLDWLQHKRLQEPGIESRVQDAWKYATQMPRSFGQISSIATNDRNEILVLRAGWESLSVMSVDGQILRYLPTAWTSVDRWASLTCLPGGAFAVCDFGIGAVFVYADDGSIQQCVERTGCIAACLGPQRSLCIASYSGKNLVFEKM